jgi:hypothetical protein
MCVVCLPRVTVAPNTINVHLARGLGGGEGDGVDEHAEAGGDDVGVLAHELQLPPDDDAE